MLVIMSMLIQKNSVEPVEIFKRDKNGNLIDNSGNPVDITKKSRYKYGKDLKKEFQTQTVTHSKKMVEAYSYNNTKCRYNIYAYKKY